MAIVYMATNYINGKRYVGATYLTLGKRSRYHIWAALKGRKRGCTRFYSSIRKYGEAAFVWKVLSEHDTPALAFSEEERVIADLKPELNMMTGGRGATVAHWTPERRAALSAVMSTKRLSEEHKRMLSEIVKRQWKRDRPKLLAHLKRAHAARRRRVECLDDGMIYDSAAEAAAAYVVAKSALIELCLGQRGRKTVGGRRFRYAE